MVVGVITGRRHVDWARFGARRHGEAQRMFPEDHQRRDISG
jgi:hypothetical protein